MGSASAVGDVPQDFGADQSLQNQRRSLGQIALTAKPVFHGIFQLRKRHLGSNFNLPIGNRESIVKDACVGEITHAEAVQPLQRAGMTLAVLFVFHADFAGEHENI